MLARINTPQNLRKNPRIHSTGRGYRKNGRAATIGGSTPAFQPPAKWNQLQQFISIRLKCPHSTLLEVFLARAALVYNFTASQGLRRVRFNARAGALFFFRAFSNPWSVLSRGSVFGRTTRYATFGRTVGGLNRRSLNAFETTVTEEKAIAPAAKMGLRRMPKNGKRTPAATGMRMVL